MAHGITEHEYYFKPKAGKVPWYQDWWNFADAVDDDVNSLFIAKIDHEDRISDIEKEVRKIGSGVFDALGEAVIRHGFGSFDEDMYVIFSPTSNSELLGEISMAGKSSHLMDVVNSGGAAVDFDWMVIKSHQDYEIKRNLLVNTSYNHNKGVDDYGLLYESQLLDLSMTKDANSVDIVSTSIDDVVQLILGHSPEVSSVVPAVSNSLDGVIIVHGLDVLDHFTFIVPVSDGENFGSWWVEKGPTEDIIYNTGDEGITFNYAIFVAL